MKYTPYQDWREKELDDREECSWCEGQGCYDCNHEGIELIDASKPSYIKACLQTAYQYCDYTLKDYWDEICKIMKTLDATPKRTQEIP